MTEFIVNYKINKRNTIEELSDDFAQLIIDELNKKQGFISVALSGGSTPKKLFVHLAENYKLKINWKRIKFFWGDERCVPPDDPESNYKLAKDFLFSKVDIPEENIFRVYGESIPEEEAVRYSEIIREILPIKNNLPVFNIVLHGLGEDGHTASIFPDRLDLINSRNICDIAEHPITKQKRITLTGSVINNSKNIVFLVTGTSKSKIVDIIIKKKEGSDKLPASFIHPVNGSLIWYLDNDAAKILK